LNHQPPAPGQASTYSAVVTAFNNKNFSDEKNQPMANYAPNLQILLRNDAISWVYLKLMR
jgi:hypothetical protein